MISWPALRSAFDDRLPGPSPWQQQVKPPRGRLRSSRGRHWELRRSHRDRRALKVVDLTRVKINQPKPWTSLTPLLGWSQSSDIRREAFLPDLSADLRCVPGVAAFRRPGLVAVLTVVPQPCFHSFGEGGEAGAVPLLQGVAGEGVTGAAALIGQQRDLVHQVCRVWDLGFGGGTKSWTHVEGDDRWRCSRVRSPVTTADHRAD